ncbi:hypothetical protein E2562_003345 [Oryza meyeriana var. granulata]|uniref:Uncharacterized protein n=1 Tax=Oryza meyeriana var. granulata TaxID=110450 RepID=A0A6G1EFC5_9ORYZ|nr:hypothetical protein E2562_003345 [Oryza meyeriana var. granulata]
MTATWLQHGGPPWSARDGDALEPNGGDRKDAATSGGDRVAQRGNGDGGVGDDGQQRPRGDRLCQDRPDSRPQQPGGKTTRCALHSRPQQADSGD